jgi:hypothetical protein
MPSSPFAIGYSGGDRPRYFFPWNTSAMNPSSKIVDESPIRPLAPPTKKQRSIHNSTTNNNNGHESSTQSNAATTVHDRFTQETEEAIAKRRAELRKLQEKRAGRVTTGPKANGVATAEGSAQPQGSARRPPVRQPLMRGSCGVNNATAHATVVQGQQPLIPSPGHVARVRHSDIFPRVSKVFSERVEAYDVNVPTIPNLINDSGVPAPRRLEAVFGNDEDFSDDQLPQHQYQPPKPVDSPSPERPLRSKSAPPSRPPLPPGPPPSSRVAEAPEAREAGNRSYAARPEPSVLGTNETASQSPLPTARQELLRSFHMYDDVNLIQVLAQQKKECGEAKRKIARLEDHVLKLTKERIVPRDLETFLVKVKEEGGEPALKWARERFPESFAQISLSDWPVSLFETVHVASPSSPRRILSFSALSPSATSGTTNSATTTFKRLRAPTPYPTRLPQQPSPDPISKDSEEYMYLVEAAKCVPIEYVSGIATIFVRCPYGAVNHYHEDDPWKDGTTAAIMEAKDTDYHETANVYQPGTVHVLAKISADGSLFVLSGVSTVRYKRNHNETEDSWKTLAEDDTIASISSFGTIMYIDGDANEKDYSLGKATELQDILLYPLCRLTNCRLFVHSVFQMKFSKLPFLHEKRIVLR